MATRYPAGLSRILGLLATAGLAACGEGEVFDRERWLNSDASLEDNRLEMADGLIHRHDLVGLSQTEVIELLGPETETAKFQAVCDEVYVLGPERGFIRIDFEWLCLNYEDGRVAEARLVRD